MPKKNRYGDHLKAWETMEAAVAANAADLPQLDAAHGKLAGMLDELRTSLNEQAALRAGKQQTTKRLRAAVVKGSKVLAMMRSVIKEHYGNSSEKLLEFGIMPRRSRSGKTVPDPEPEPTTPKPPPPPVE